MGPTYKKSKKKNPLVASSPSSSSSQTKLVSSTPHSLTSFWDSQTGLGSRPSPISLMTSWLEFLTQGFGPKNWALTTLVCLRFRPVGKGHVRPDLISLLRVVIGRLSELEPFITGILLNWVNPFLDLRNRNHQETQRVFKEGPENALGKMQLRSYMNGHSR